MTDREIYINKLATESLEYYTKNLGIRVEDIKLIEEVERIGDNTTRTTYKYVVEVDGEKAVLH
jgi:hypothetical protein